MSVLNFQFPFLCRALMEFLSCSAGCGQIAMGMFPVEELVAVSADHRRPSSVCGSVLEEQPHEHWQMDPAQRRA
jgi:hypothetical protein